MLATYDQDGKANAMNAAWGGVYDHNKEMEKYNDILDKIYQQTLKEALIYLPLYIQNYKKHAPLPERYYHNYK